MLSFDTLSKSEKATVRRLNDAQLLAAYDIQNLKFRIEDAMCRADALYPGMFGMEDFKTMAETFIENYDCNISENDFWNSIVEDAARQKEGQRPGA